MLNCKETTRLQSDEMEHPLPVLQRFALWLHLAMCRGCRNFGQHIKFLRRIGKAYGEVDEERLRDS